MTDPFRSPPATAGCTRSSPSAQRHPDRSTAPALRPPQRLQLQVAHDAESSSTNTSQPPGTSVTPREWQRGVHGQRVRDSPWTCAALGATWHPCRTLSTGHGGPGLSRKHRVLAVPRMTPLSRRTHQSDTRAPCTGHSQQHRGTRRSPFPPPRPPGVASRRQGQQARARPGASPTGC